jgi:steroid 5-alpha reductase family enzyme
MSHVLLTNLLIVTAMMFAVWLMSLQRRDVSIVDLFWGIGFVIVAWTSWWQAGQSSLWTALPVGMTTLWGLRLSGYLTWRNWGKPEDYRYASLRQRFGVAFPLLSLPIVFLLQAVLIWVVSLPVQLAVFDADETAEFAWVLCGIAAWGAGLFFETVGDIQLSRFKGDPRNQGKILDSGLWRYTRHPNYFGDFLVWWGLSFVAIGLGAAWWTLVGPVVMSVLLMRVSGVTLLESSLRERKPGYADYTRNTNAFFPWRPKS